MAIFQYSISTTFSQASGTIDATDALAAEAALKDLYGGQGFVDAKGAALENVVESVNLTEVKLPEDVLIEVREAGTPEGS